MSVHWQGPPGDHRSVHWGNWRAVCGHGYGRAHTDGDPRADYFFESEGGRIRRPRRDRGFRVAA